MSTGPRLPLVMAHRAANSLAALLGLAAGGGMVVGSVRRGRPDVGDIEFVAPAASPLADTLYQTIDTEIIAAKRGTAVRGLKPGFLYCSLRVGLIDRQTGEKVDFPVEIHRFTPENRGWIETMRTGPGEFGRLFLVWWKQVHGIGQSGKASIDGHLVDREGVVVPVADERACFEKANLRWIEPERRDAATFRDFRALEQHT